nr:MAM and LDL-receptor class A domain-containing protein 1 isoform X2 [Crassostrea gigas]
MGLLQPAVVLLLLLIVLCIAGHAVDKHNGRVIAKREARIALNELRKKHISHVLKRSADSEIDEEEANIDLTMIERELERFEDTLHSTEETGANQHEAKGGEKLIQEALKGDVDPDSDVVNLLESMYVDEGSRHNQHPKGIENIAAKKGKVFGDTHDAHRLTQHQIKELNQNGGRKKNFLKSATFWTDLTIPYTIHSSFSGFTTSPATQNPSTLYPVTSFQTTLYPVTSFPTTQTSSPPVVDQDLHCTFETGTSCFLNNSNDDFDWQTGQGSAPSGGTGPTSAYEGHQYFYIDPSARQGFGSALLRGPTVRTTRPFCLRFAYQLHAYRLYDTSSSTLTVLMKLSDPDDYRHLFISHDDSGNHWIVKHITVPPSNGEILFSGLLRSSTGGNIAIDDVHFVSGDCYSAGFTTSPATQNPSTLYPVTSFPTTQTSSPPVVDQDLHCTFETGTSCFLNNSNNDDFDWQTGQGSAPSGGTGPTSAYEGHQYFYKDPSARQGFGSALLRGPTVRTTRPFCLRFAYQLHAYRLYDTSSSTLTVLMKLSDPDDYRHLFISHDDSGNHWIVKHITVPPSNGEILFSGLLRSSTGGNIAIDDVHFVSGDCYSAGFTTSPATQNPSTLYPVTSFQTTLYPVTSFPTQFPTTQTPSPPVVDQDLHCTFETGTSCFLNNVNRDSFDWQTGQGSAASGGTGPTSAYEGHQYSYIDHSAREGFGIAIQRGPTFRTTQPFCLRFAYQLHGTAICTLIVEMNFSDGQRDLNLFQSYDDSGNNWIVKQITVQPSNGEILFIGILRSSTRGNIAIDDVHFVSGGCYSVPIALPLSCTFEVGTECFLKDAVGSDDFDWTILSGRTPLYGTGPSNAAEGSRYAYIESTGNDPHSKASLERIVQIPKDGNMCLSFNYHMYGQTVGTLKVLFQDLIFFHEVGNKGDQWNKAEFTLFNVSSTVVSKIQFTATQGTGYEGDIAIDNIQLTEGKCAIIARCTFEVGTECFLKDVEVTDDFDWTILSGETPSLETGPAKAFEGSRYAYIESTGIDPYSRASLEGIVQLPKDGDMCLSFNYHMYGETNDSLEVLFQNITYFNESGNKGNQWNKAKFSLFDQNSTVVSKIQFTATRGSSNKSDIAIDNIQLTEGGCVKDCRINPCRTNEICIQETSTTYRCDCRPGFIGHFCDVVPGQANCTFEKGEDCFLKNSTRNDFDWSLNSGRTPSSKTGPGSAKQGSWYAYIETTNRLLGQKAMLIPKYRFKSEERCLTFAYYMCGETCGSLRVLQEKYKNTTELFSKSGEQSNSSTNWKIASLSINHSVHQRIVFEVTIGTSFTGDIALDDIKYFPGRCACDHITCKNGGTCLSKQNGGFCQCPPEFTGNRCEKKIGVLASCTFDDGSCFLTNINGQDTMDWLITKKRTPSLNTGPNKPLDGNYTFIEASGRTAGDNAILSSAATSQFFLRGPACLRFFYNMNGRGIGTLNVFAGESNSEQNVWNISGNQNDIWTPVAVDIPPVNDLVIWIEAIRGKSYLSDIAIDTIELFDSPCIASLSSLPQRCTFEDGADCFLKDDKKFDDFDWIVKYGRTLSRDTGPSMAAEGKKYAYIEASGKHPGVRATLERLVPVPADGKMCLSFEYHMFGRTMGSLEVLFQNTTIFHEFSDKGNTWNKAELNLNGLNSTDVPLLQFTATRGSGFQSDVAIDNVQLAEGECAVPLPT